MSLDEWSMILQLLGIGFSCGLMFGDFLDRRDVLHWKYYDRCDGSDE